MKRAFKLRVGKHLQSSSATRSSPSSKKSRASVAKTPRSGSDYGGDYVGPPKKR